MAYLTETILNDELGATLVTRLTGGRAGTVTRWISSATARVETALQIGGYTAGVPSTAFAADASDCPEAIIGIAALVWKRLAYERNDLSIPVDQIRAIDQELRDIEEGRVEIKGLSRSVDRAPGGVLGSNATDSAGERYRPQVFSRTRMRGC